MWLDNRVEGSTSRVGVPANTLCKFGGSEVAIPSSNYLFVALVTRPRKI